MNHGDGLSERTETFPGLGRLRYFLSLIGVYLLFFAAVVLTGATQPLVANIAVIALFVCLIVLVVLRFRNQGASAWWVIGIFVPILNIYIAMRALAYPEGYAKHKSLDRAGKIVVTLYCLFIVGALAAVAIPAYQEYVEKAQSTQQVSPGP